MSAPTFVALSPDEIVVEDGPDDVEPLAEAIERELAPPYRAEAVRRDAGLWAVAARKIELVELPGVAGQRARARDARRRANAGRRRRATFGSIPALERPEHVTRARRIDGEIWEIEVAPL